MSDPMAILLAAIGVRRQPSPLHEEAEELTKTARELRKKLESYKDAPDPLGAFLSDVHNNREFQKP